MIWLWVGLALLAWMAVGAATLAILTWASGFEADTEANALAFWLWPVVWAVGIPSVIAHWVSSRNEEEEDAHEEGAPHS